MGRAILLRPGIGLRSAPRSPYRNVEDGGAPSRGEIVTLHNKTLPARLSPISQDGFPLRPLANARVSKCGGVRGCDHPGDRASRRTRHSAEGRESTLAACSRPRTREFGARAGGYAVGFGAFAIALLKRVM